MVEKRFKEMQTVQKVTIGQDLICDKCGKVIYKHDSTKSHYTISAFVDWYSVTTGHNDWGNDSCESEQHYDVCKDCMNEIFAEYIERSHPSKKIGECHNTEYFEVHHQSGYYNNAKEGEKDAE